MTRDLPDHIRRPEHEERFEIPYHHLKRYIELERGCAHITYQAPGGGLVYDGHIIHITQARR